MRKLLYVVVMYCLGLSIFAQGTITTSPPLVSNNGSTGVSFRIEAGSAPVEITGLSNIFATSSGAANVWVRQGGVKAGSGNPSITTADGWTLAVSNASIANASTAGPAVNIPFGGVKIPIAANEAIGVFIEAATGSVRYQTGTSSDQQTFTDGTLTVSVADSVAYGGTRLNPTNNPRRFLGSVTYALAVTGACPSFSNFSIDSISAGAAKVNWTPGSGNTSFKLEYGPAGFTPGTGTVISGPLSGAQPPVILTGLSALTNYDIWFEEYCNAGGDTVRFPAPQTFSTTNLCAAPTAFAASNIGSVSVDLTWSQAGAYNSAWILYGPAGTTPGSTGWLLDSVQAPATSFTLNGLNPSTAYDLYLATNCGALNGISDTVGPINITTLINGPQGLNCTAGSPGVLFADDFESTGLWTGNFGTGASNWNYNSNGTGSANTGPSGAHSGSQYIYTETSGTLAGANIEAISPLIDLSTSLNSAELSFWLHAYGAGIDSVKVQVGSTATGPWTTVFTNVGELQTDELDPWQNVGVNLDAYVGSAIYLRFLVVHGSGFTGDVAIDLVEVNSCQTCPIPSNLNLTGLGSDSAFFSWNGSGSAYEVNWGPAGFIQGSPTSNFDSTSTTSIGIGGLNGNTAYEFYVRNDCSDSANGFSGWVGPLPFTTLCSPFTAPYLNNFDNDSLNAPPLCWDQVIIGGTNPTGPVVRVEQGTALNPALSPSNYVRLFNWNADTVWLVSPQFSDMSTGTNRISFEARTTSGASGNNIIIGTISAPGQNASFVGFDTITLTANYTQYVVDITTANGYNGSDEFLVIAHASASGFVTYYLDDFVYEAIPACVPPLRSSLGLDYVTASDAQVYWANSSAGDTTFIEYGQPGFTPGLNPLGVVSVSGSLDTALITGLAPETDYEFYVQDSCFGASAASPYVGPFAFKTACLITAAATLPINDGFENYTGGPTFTGGNAYFCNPSYNWAFEPSGFGRARLQAGTGFYNNGTHAFTMDQENFFAGGASNFLVMTVNLNNYLSAGGINLSFHFMDHGIPVSPDNRVWVRGDVGDPWVEIINLDNLNLATGQWDSIGPIDILAPLVAAGQSIGASTQIRFGQNGANRAFTTTFGTGYTIDDVVLDAVSCPKPTGLAISAIVDTSATLSWTSSGGASQYQYWFGPSGFFQGTNSSGGLKQLSTSTSVTIDTLSPSTCYQFLVRSVCAPGDSSAWVGPIDVCTTCPVGYSMPYFTDFESNTLGIATGNPAGWDNCWTHLATANSTVRWETEIATGSNSNSLNTGPFLDNTLAPNAGGRYMYLETSSLGGPADLISPGIDISTATNPQLEFAYHMFGATTGKLVLLAENVSTGALTTLDSIVGQQQTAGSDPFNTYAVNLSSLSPGSYRFIFRGYRGTSFTGDIAIDDVYVEEAPTCPAPSGLLMDSSSTNSITASWTSNATGTSWLIEYGPQGFTPGTGTTVVASTNPFTITGLNAATGYDVYVAEICSATDTSQFAGPTFMNTTLCSASNLCWYYLDLEDSWGDGWNGAEVTVFQNGVPVGTFGSAFTTGSLFQDSVQLCDGLNTTFVLSNAGAFANEVGLTVNTPYGTLAGQYSNNPSTAQGDTLVNIFTQCAVPTCPAPTALATANISGTSADISWTSGGTGSSWEIEYGSGSILPGAGTRVTATSNPFTLSGLNGATSYNAYVREICSPGDTSVWAGPINFFTLCVAFNAPYFTDFENIPIGQASGTPASWANCWTHSAPGNVRWESEDATGANENSPGTGPHFDNTTPNAIGGTYMYLETSQTGAPAELTSPVIDFSAINNPELTFYYHMFGADINKLVVYAQDASGTRTVLDSIVGQQQMAGSDSFALHSIDLSSLAASSYAFVFEGHRGNGFAGDIAIDDFSVDSAGANALPCLAPTMLTATSNIGCDSIEVDWLSNTGGSIIEYGPAGFTPGTGTFTAIVTTPYTISGLNPATAYDIWIADTCGADTSAYAPLSASTANAPLPIAIASASDTIIAGQFTVYLDAGASSNATAYTWDFGNGTTGSGSQDTVLFTTNGVYTIVLSASNACGTSTDTITINANVSLKDNPLANSLNVYPNPAQYSFTISFPVLGSADVQISLRDAQGRSLINLNDRSQGGKYHQEIDVSSLVRGIYMLEIKSGSLTAHRRIIIN